MSVTHDEDRYSFSFLSTSGIETPASLTDDDTDGFEFVSSGRDSGCSLWDSSSSASTSVPPQIHAYEFQHGRRYHSLKSGRYPLPNDIGEQHREEVAHALMLQLTDGKLFLSDVGEEPKQILDVGTGTGLWAIDVADLYPSAHITGTDLSPVQPKWIPPNARMFIEDCEDPEWLQGPVFDLIHFRGVAEVLRDLDKVVATAYRNLKPGGWIEFQELEFSVLCDDSTMKRDDPLRTFVDLGAEGMRQYGCQAFGKQDICDTLERAGFSEIHLVTKKVPVSPWALDRKLKTLGTMLQLTLLESLDAFAAKPLAALGMPAEERKNAMKQARRSLEEDKAHRYMNYHFCFGRKSA